ncbi:protein-tyrosine phosphatase-like protein [Gymnopilus junonius]|uniref:Protein-tyrosine phosphatase-like protein n=1 Tax=Gymnopilus junonius TaxID=109634 RepID=A0A9P5TKD2_GYMJU|nr:protein-tyrosine phosphatase-like protein [Gymnopilus junonius]
MNNGGWKNFREVTQNILPNHRLFRASSPNYLGMDLTQELRRESVDFLLQNGINRIISLNQYPYSEEELASLESAGITYLHIPVKDFHPPTIEQLSKAFEFYRADPDGATTLVHCGAGYGRSGTCNFPEEAAWRSENRVENAAQINILKEIRENCQKERGA